MAASLHRTGMKTILRFSRLRIAEFSIQSHRTEDGHEYRELDCKDAGRKGMGFRVAWDNYEIIDNDEDDYKFLDRAEDDAA
jgi:hypothetical protein